MLDGSPAYLHFGVVSGTQGTRQAVGRVRHVSDREERPEHEVHHQAREARGDHLLVIDGVPRLEALLHQDVGVRASDRPHERQNRKKENSRWALHVRSLVVSAATALSRQRRSIPLRRRQSPRVSQNA